MNREDRRAYWYPAVENLFPNALDGDRALEKALGIKTYSEYCMREEIHDYPLSEEWVTLLTQLAGPHGHTILKAYRIKKGLARAEQTHKFFGL